MTKSFAYDQHIFDGLPVWHGDWDMPDGPQVIEE